MIEFRMPSLGAEMEAGTLLEWRVKPGDRVKRGDIIAVVDTEKAAIEVEVWQDGTIERLIVEPNTRVPVGTVLAELRAPGEAPGEPPHPFTTRVRISPAARKKAQELGLDLATLRGGGPEGSITLEDVEASAPVAAAPSSAARATRMRSAIAAAMARSKREIPHYYLSTEIDMAPVLGWLSAENALSPVTERILPLIPLLKATALALKKNPELNGFYRDGRFEACDAVHVGVAISLRDGGLTAPALHDVDTKPISSLMSELQDLVARARSGTLRSSEFSDPTVTVTHLGENSADSVLGIIYPPQVALIGFGEIRTRPWVSGDQIVARPLITATLSADHRNSDGHRGALFLSELRRLLESPSAWVGGTGSEGKAA